MHLYTHSHSSDKTLRLLEGDTHSLTQGDRSADILEEVLGWLGARV